MFRIRRPSRRGDRRPRPEHLRRRCEPRRPHSGDWRAWRDRRIARRARYHRTQIDYAFVDGGEHQRENVSRPVPVFHVRNAAASGLVDEAAKTTTRLLPQITLRFEGTNSAGQKFSFDVALDRLVTLAQGMVMAVLPISATWSWRTPPCRAATPGSPSPARRCRSRISARPTARPSAARRCRAGEPVVLHAGNKLRLGDVDLLVRQL